MSAPYERVRKALAGTPLAGELDRLNAELHLTPDSPEWVIAALTIIGAAGLQGDLHTVERRLTRLPETLDESMRASAVEIVQGFTADIASETTTQIKNETLSMMKEVADIMAGHSEAVADKSVTAVQEASKAISASSQAAHQSLKEAAIETRVAAAVLGSWSSPWRVGTICLGVIIAGLMFVAGATSNLFHEQATCGKRVAALTARYPAHQQNVARDYVCAPLIHFHL